jgi:hypothetical protein
MPTPLLTVVGAAAVALGVPWAIWPIRFRQYQIKVLYLGHREEAEADYSDKETLVGRIGGLVLAVIGLLILLGVLPP